MADINHHQLALIAADAVSAAAILGAFTGILPPLAALGALVWYCVQVWESDTVQTWVKGHRHVARRRRVRRKQGHHPHKHPPHVGG